MMPHRFFPGALDIADPEGCIVTQSIDSNHRDA